MYGKGQGVLKINCKTKDTIRLTECIPFQGNLKKRTDKDMAELCDSLRSEGLMMPFAIWVHEGQSYLLDGHGRREALTRMAFDEPELLSQEYPCIYVEAETEADARKALLQITSSYGRVTKQGVRQFCVSIPEYRAPSINRFVVPKKVVVKKPDNAIQKTIIRVRIDNDKVQRVLDILRQFSFIEVV